MENFGFFGSVKNFDALTMFKDGEDDKYLVEYLLVDDNGFDHRCSPFLIPVGTVFEHNFGTYEVISIDRKMENIVVFCERVTKEKPMFDSLIAMKNQFN